MFPGFFPPAFGGNEAVGLEAKHHHHLRPSSEQQREQNGRLICGRADLLGNSGEYYFSLWATVPPAWTSFLVISPRSKPWIPVPMGKGQGPSSGRWLKPEAGSSNLGSSGWLSTRQSYLRKLLIGSMPWEEHALFWLASSSRGGPQGDLPVGWNGRPVGTLWRRFRKRCLPRGPWKSLRVA